ncbi:LysR family transcriptional regulator [Alcaligenes faecalis]|uniref:LysR family transcriptional regulator n=1 Tax=Alcaligenes faecalis TaxID=511 RepID=UPI0018D0701F|nr:LysR family transcriptional regulator [Alcaligenes faecalis]MBH0312160.1 LysR family transcriptional regulator [Alcaligenes faecalis]
MEIRQLEAFAAVMSAGSVTAAGRLLDRSQPVVSRQIQELEQELGFRLFTRTRPQVTLTEQGREFYLEARPVLMNLEVLQTRALEIARGGLRPLRIVTTHALAIGLVPQALGIMEQHDPAFKQKLIIDTVKPEEVVQAIDEGRADLAVTSLPLDIDGCTLHWSGQSPCLLGMAVNHPLAKQELVRLSDIRGTPLISIQNRHRLRHTLATALLRASPQAPEDIRHIEVASSLEGLVLASQGVGVSLIDPFTAHGLPLPNVVLRPIDIHVPYMVGVVSLRSRELRPDAQRLVEAMRQYVLQFIPRFVLGDDTGLPSTQDPFDSL